MTTAKFYDFGGGWTWGPRYLLPVVPALAAGAAMWLAAVPDGRSWGCRSRWASRRRPPGWSWTAAPRAPLSRRRGCRRPRGSFAPATRTTPASSSRGRAPSRTSCPSSGHRRALLAAAGVAGTVRVRRCGLVVRVRRRHRHVLERALPPASLARTLPGRGGAPALRAVRDCAGVLGALYRRVVFDVTATPPPGSARRRP